MQSRVSGLHRFSVLTACVTFLLIIAGALVVGHDAGLAVPDWPLSYGTLMPPMVGGILYEHSHRLIAGLVATLTTILAVWLWRAEQRRWVRWLGIAALLAVIAQAVLGGLTVLYLLPFPVLVGHACLAQTFFCIMLSLALVTGPAWQDVGPRRTEDSGFLSFRHLSCATTAATFIQLILGAARRHKGLGLLPHVVWAGMVSVLVLWVLFLALNRLPHGEKYLRTLSLIAGGLLGVQLALGFGSYWTRLMAQGAPQPEPPVIYTTTAHVAVGALLLGTSLVTTLLAYRRLAAPGEAFSFTQSPQKSMA